MGCGKLAMRVEDAGLTEKCYNATSRGQLETMVEDAGLTEKCYNFKEAAVP